MHLRTTQECSFATVYHSLYVSQEVVENDLQTDPENHLHQPHLNTPIITLSPPHSDE